MTTKAADSAVSQGPLSCAASARALAETAKITPNRAATDAKSRRIRVQYGPLAHRVNFVSSVTGPRAGEGAVTTIITCGHTRAGLAATRALGRRGNAVAVGAPVRPCLAMWSRYASTTFLVPDAALAARSFVERIADEAAGRHAAMVLAGTDAALWALSRWRETLPAGAQRVLPPHAAVARALDREALHDRARAAGVRGLDSVRVNGPEDLDAACAALGKRGDMPILVRSRVPWVEREDGGRNVFETVPAAGIAAQHLAPTPGSGWYRKSPADGAAGAVAIQTAARMFWRE